MSKAFSNLLKHIGNLSYTEKERVFQWVKRYRCKCCSKTFTDTTNTVLYLTRKGDEWITFVDSRSNESTKHNIKEFLLTSFAFEMTDNLGNLCLSKLVIESI